jgi:hypothetical protein
MTNLELRKLLEMYPDDALVLFPGYEGGHRTIDKVEVRLGYVELYRHKADYYGKYDISEEVTDIKGIFLGEGRL